MVKTEDPVPTKKTLVGYRANCVWVWWGEVIIRAFLWLLENCIAKRALLSLIPRLEPNQAAL